jgi:hypothetical protein
MTPILAETEDFTPETKTIPSNELKSSASPIPEVKEFDSATCTAEELVEAIKVAGGVIVRNLLTQEELDQMEKDVRPHLDKDVP